jgi:hypothetical protein
MMKIRVPVAIALAGCLLLAGCGSEDPARGPTTTSVAEFDKQLWTTTEELTAECMRQAGFDYQPRPYQGAPPAGPLFDLNLTLDQARSGGFGIVDGLINATAPAPQVTPSAESDPQAQDAWQAAMFGSGATQGCRASAEAEARGRLGDDVASVETQLVSIGQRIEADPRTTQLWQRWAQCMAGQGITATDPRQLAKSLSQEATAALVIAPDTAGGDDSHGAASPTAAQHDPQLVAQLRTKEIAAATATVTCFQPLHDDYLVIVEDAKRGDGG